MLKIIKISNRFQVQNFLEQFDPSNTTWVVSDLNSKLSMQKYLLNKFGSVEDIAVLRASDFWKLLLRRAAPTKRIVSIDFVSGLLRQFMESSEELRLKGRSDQTLIQYMQALAMIVFNPSGQSMMREWFQENPMSFDKWGDWYARALVGHLFLEKKNLICVNWIAAYVQHHVDFHVFWSRNLIFDLGPELSSVEAEIIKNLAEVCDVQVLQPAPKATWASRFEFLLKPYQDLTTAKSEILMQNDSGQMRNSRTFLRFASSIAEIKDATAKVRKWLDQGVLPNQILICAPDIEAYWPALQVHLQVEGVPVSKDICARLSALPAVQRWLAHLKLSLGKMDVRDLELAYYQSREMDLLRSEDFKSTFSLLFDLQDLNRDEKISKWFSETPKFANELSRDDFAKVILTFWDAQDEVSYLDLSLREIFSNATQTDSLPVTQWISFLEKLLSKKEIVIEKGIRNAVVVSNLMAGQDLSIRKRIFIGLSDEALRGQSKTSISHEDQKKLSLIFGAIVDSGSQDFKDFELRWQAEHSSDEDVFCFSATSPSGDLQTPSSFWIEGMIQSVSFLQNEQADLKHAIETVVAHENCRMDQLLTVDEFQPYVVTEPIPIQGPLRMSASSMEEYLKCPFRYAANKVFQLKDIPDSDLDVDARAGGSFVHSLFEALTTEPRNFHFKDEDLRKVIEDVKAKVQLRLADERMWKSASEKYFNLAKRFLQFEKEWFQKFPKTKTFATEYKFDVKWNENTACVDPDGQVTLTGKMDRMDWDQNREFMLIDYKSSLNGKAAFRSWFERHDIQLLFYIWIFEKSLSQQVLGPKVQAEVAGAFYYGFKKLDRSSKGILVQGFGENLMSPAKTKRSYSGTVEEFHHMMQNFEQNLNQVLLGIRQGNFEAKPSDEKICQFCEWRQTCRASHLN